MNKSIKVLVVLAVIVIAIIGGYSIKNTKSGEQNKHTKVGIILPLSGQLASLAEPMKQAALMAIEDAGMKESIEVIIEDDQSCDPKSVLNAAHKLVDIDKVGVVYGPACSGAVLSILPITEQNKVVVMTPSASSESLSGAGKYNFRTIASDADKNIALVNYIIAKGYKKAAILYDKSQDALVQQDKDTKEAFIASGGAIVAEEQFVDIDKDVRAQLSVIKRSGADVVFMAAFPKTGGLIIKQARALGMTQQFAATDAAAGTMDTINAGGKVTDGLLFPFTTNPENKENRDFLAAYKAKFGKDASTYTAESYDAMLLVAKAIKAGNSSADSIKEQLNKIGNNYQGASGVITFDSNGDVKKPIVIKTIENGKFVEAK